MSTNICDRGVTEVRNKGTVFLSFTDTSLSHTLNLRAASPPQLKKLGKHLSRMAFTPELQLKSKKKKVLQSRSLWAVASEAAAISAGRWRPEDEEWEEEPSLQCTNPLE